MAELNGNARAVAVAVQSRLYNMKNTSTASYQYLNDDGAVPEKHFLGDVEENVRYAKNFGTEAQVNVGKSMLFSGALTDSELLKGNILVIFKESTADVLEVYFSEKEFDVQEIIDMLKKVAYHNMRFTLR